MLCLVGVEVWIQHVIPGPNLDHVFLLFFLSKVMVPIVLCGAKRLESPFFFKKRSNFGLLSWVVADGQ